MSFYGVLWKEFWNLRFFFCRRSGGFACFCVMVNVRDYEVCFFIFSGSSGASQDANRWLSQAPARMPAPKADA